MGDETFGVEGSPPRDAPDIIVSRVLAESSSFLRSVLSSSRSAGERAISVVAIAVFLDRAASSSIEFCIFTRACNSLACNFNLWFWLLSSPTVFSISGVACGSGRLGVRAWMYPSRVLDLSFLIDLCIELIRGSPEGAGRSHMSSFSTWGGQCSRAESSSDKASLRVRFTLSRHVTR